VAKATKNKKNKEGRHVGLDIYDLLIEALVLSCTVELWAQASQQDPQANDSMSVPGRRVVNLISLLILALPRGYTPVAF
jgi:hypothetical protein